MPASEASRDDRGDHSHVRGRRRKTEGVPSEVELESTPGKASKRDRRDY